MPQDPIEFRIMQNLQSSLRSISKAGGYHHDVDNLAVKLDPNHEVESLVGSESFRPFLILEYGSQEFEFLPASQIITRVPLTIHAVDDSDVADDDSWMHTYLTLCSDIEQAVAVDTTRGGLATDTRILDRLIHRIEGREVWAMNRCEIRVHRTYGAPNG
jgi:hypothetical protein